MLNLIVIHLFFTLFIACNQFNSDGLKYHHPHRQLDIFKRGDPKVIAEMDLQNSNLSSSSNGTDTYNTQNLLSMGDNVAFLARMSFGTTSNKSEE